MICIFCMREIDIEDVFVNWCGCGEHTLRDKLNDDFCLKERRCLIW